MKKNTKNSPWFAPKLPKMREILKKWLLFSCVFIFAATVDDSVFCNHFSLTSKPVIFGYPIAAPFRKLRLDVWNVVHIFFTADNVYPIPPTALFNHGDVILYLPLPTSLRTSTYLCLPLRTWTYLYLHLSTSIYVYMPLPTSTYLYLPLPTSTYIYLHLPTSTYLNLPLPTSIYLYLPLPTLTSSYIYLPHPACNYLYHYPYICNYLSWHEP